tara:strand:- start:217 stop:546 length:330 start_codon:yes stop_codon:yes gene_type:complete
MDWIEVKKETHQIKDYILVECIAEIIKNDNGEIRQYETHEILTIGDEYPSVFNWEENNYSCDCNRRLFFNRAKGIERDEDWDVECTDGKFSVNLKNKKDGSTYYREYGI